jgi:hypothetical protein
MDNIIYDDEAIRRLKPAIPRSQYRELHYSDAVILLDMRRTIGGLINNKAKNVLTHPFWAFLNGILADSGADALRTDGASYTMHTSIDAPRGSAYVVFGTGTASESFKDYKLASRNTSIEGSTLTPVVIQESDKRRLRFGRVSNGVGSEVGIQQSIYSYPTGGGGVGTNDFLFARKVFTIPGVGYNVYYDIIVYPPFLDNFVYYLFGLLTDTNQNLINLSGNQLPARTSGDANASRLYLQVGTSSEPFSFSTYSLTNPVTLSSTHIFGIGVPSYAISCITGSANLSSAMTINDVGLVQNIYDASGNTSPVLLVRIVLPTPIIKSAGDFVTISVVLYASA